MLPDKYLNAMKSLLKDEYDDYLACFDNPQIHSLRVNTSKISIDRFKEIFPYNLEQVPWCKDGFYFDDLSISKHPYYYAGLYYLQEASAMLPAEVLPIEEGDIVLDACAAPGGKSLKLLDKLNNTGLLVSNDISISRANALLRNIERAGFSNYYVIAKDIIELEEHFPKYFDKILLDAPCSGEGMFRKDKALIESWKERDSEYFSPIQKRLIQACINMLKDGGKLVYSTCTFDVREDEEIIQYALDNNSNIKLLPIEKYDGFKDANDGYGVKLFPHRIKGEGHYVCLLQKNGNSHKRESRVMAKTDISFINELNKRFYDGIFEKINDYIYFLKPINTKGIRVLRSGLLLGKETKYGFEPSQQLAMNLKINEYNNVLNLKSSDNLVEKYLKGETIENNSNLNGMVLVCVDDCPLGFAKAKNGVLKNKIDKGWIKR